MIPSIRRRRVFAELRDRGQRVNHGAVRLTYLDQVVVDLESTPQVAYALGRRFGTAVERNRARRRLRDAFARSWHHHVATVDPALQLNGAFLLSGHRRLLSAPFEQLVDDINACFARLMTSGRKRRGERS